MKNTIIVIITKGIITTQARKSPIPRPTPVIINNKIKNSINATKKIIRKIINATIPIMIPTIRLRKNLAIQYTIICFQSALKAPRMFMKAVVIPML